eukprot:18342-Heterococcus_DN1.PRE.3
MIGAGASAGEKLGLVRSRSTLLALRNAARASRQASKSAAPAGHRLYYFSDSMLWWELLFDYHTHIHTHNS